MKIIVTEQAEGLNGPEVWVQVQSDDIAMSWEKAKLGLDVQQAQVVDQCWTDDNRVYWISDPLDGADENEFDYEDWFVLTYKPTTARL